MTGEDVHIRLEAFEGPLDLLLFLIRKHEVDIHDIPISSITDQYCSLIRAWTTRGRGRLDIDAAGDFLVMAATLMEIKSRMLIPSAPKVVSTEGIAKEPEDPRAELVRQLLDYKKYRDAADALEHRGAEWSKRYPAARAMVPDVPVEAGEDEGALDLEDLHMADLVEAFRKISETVNFDRLGDHQVMYDDTPIELHAQDILSRLQEMRASTSVPGGRMEFRELFSGRTRSEAIGLFLALLELVRNRKVRVRQQMTRGQGESGQTETEGVAGASATPAAHEFPIFIEPREEDPVIADAGEVVVMPQQEP